MAYMAVDGMYIGINSSEWHYVVYMPVHGMYIGIHGIKWEYMVYNGTFIAYMADMAARSIHVNTWH